MDKTKHTPGPWTAHDDDGTGTLPCVLSDKVNAGGNFYVAQCNVFEDARLIAAAPAMEHLLKQLGMWAEVIEKHYPVHTGLIRDLYEARKITGTE